MFSTETATKKLLLCRHADVLPAYFGQTDFDRKLSQRGIVQCQQGKIWLQQHVPVKPIFICSAAERARATAILLASAFEDAQVQSFEELYECPASGLLRFVNNLPESGSFLMLTGHNPGISAFASNLSEHNFTFSTCQMVLLELFAEKWDEVSFGAAEVKKVFVPDEIGS